MNDTTQLGTSFFSEIWQGISSLPFFDFGFNWDKVLIGTFIINVSVAIIRTAFQFDYEINKGIGKNARQKSKGVKA